VAICHYDYDYNSTIHSQSPHYYTKLINLQSYRSVKGGLYANMH